MKMAERYKEGEGAGTTKKLDLTKNQAAHSPIRITKIGLAGSRI